MLLYGRIVRAPGTDPIRMLTFVPGTNRPTTERYIRNVGRPRNEWAKMLWAEALRVAGGKVLDKAVESAAGWQILVRKRCSDF